MGRNSKAKRDARHQRFRQAGAAGTGGGGPNATSGGGSGPDERTSDAAGPTAASRADRPGGSPFSTTPTATDALIADLVIRGLKAAVDAHVAGDPTAARRYGEQLAWDRDAWPERAVDVAVARALQSALRYAWALGWVPVDVNEIARRRASEVARSLVIDVMAADTATYAIQTIDPHWLDQLDMLDADKWWDGGRPHLSQWCQRHRLDRGTGLETVVELIAVLSTLPKLPTILARPGQAHGGGRARAGVDEKMLGRVRALLAKAESTDFPEEAEALSAKAQELMSRYAIERAMLDVETHVVPLPGARRIWLDQPYVSAKSSLVGAVAVPNRCCAVSSVELGFVTIIGDDLDLQIVELLTTSLMVQATAAMVGSGQRTGSAGPPRTRSFRHAFLLAYAVRVGERLRARAEETVAAAGRELVPVFAERERVIGETYKTMFPRVRSRSFSVTNGAGWEAGRAAADAAVLHVGREAVVGG